MYPFLLKADVGLVKSFTLGRLRWINYEHLVSGHIHESYALGNIFICISISLSHLDLDSIGETSRDITLPRSTYSGAISLSPNAILGKAFQATIVFGMKLCLLRSDLLWS